MPPVSSVPPRRRFRAAAACLLSVLAIAACTRSEEAARQPPPATVTTLQVQPAPWSDPLTAQGTVQARESVTITASVSQTVADVAFESGDVVRRGQPLVTLTRAQQGASLAAAQAALRDAEQVYARSRQLAEAQLIARASLDSQRAAVDAARARVAAEGAAVADRVIRAPFAGVLGLRLVSPGTLVTPGTPITTLDDVSLVRVDFSLPERNLTDVAVGQRVRARSAAWPGRTFDGVVAAIDARVDPASRAVTVQAELPNPDHALRPGMLLDVAVDRGQRQALVIPELALQQSGAQASVFRVEGDAVRQVPVEIGTRRDGKVEIVSGLRAGDRIVVEGTVKLRDGARIRDVSAGPPAADAAPSRSAPGR